ncbi:metallophosphoesterase family protein [Asaia prunellae]|uniref:metallophosphoesterase family protein n=1 Tax=Asaia prunellae TaxID=610245 RepID=UPI00046EC267|nr:metallophosphoesterase [Asaia prunellae]
MTLNKDSPVVLAHLSDVHLPPPSPLPSWRHFTNKRALSVASWKRHRVHHHLPALSDAIREDINKARPGLILNTGDLTNFGLSEEFSNAAAWLRTMEAPCLVVPGNHDAMIRESWQQTGACWSPWMQACEENAFPYLHEQGDLAIIGLNSAIPSLPFMACGRIGKAQRARLADLLAATRDRCRVVMIHHPPRGRLVPWRKSLLDLKAVAAVIARHGAAMVLHGHSHDATLSTVPGTSIPLIGVASASLHSTKPWRHSGWNRIAIERRDSGWEVDLTTRQFTQALGWRYSRHRTWLIRDGQG